MNRYSYVLNNPINASDPSGHKCVGDPGECMNVDTDGNETTPINGSGGWGTSVGGGVGNGAGGMNEKNQDQRGGPSNSTIRLGFGDVDLNGNPDPDKTNGGLGTVIYVGNGYSIIVTATHVQRYGRFFFYRTGNDAHMNMLPLSEVETFPYGFTDAMVVHLPIELPEEFVPAEIAHPTFHGGEHVSVAYFDDQSQSLQVLETQIRNNPIKPGQYSGSGIAFNNPQDLLAPGDSGGGVFYNGYLVGVNSYHWADELGPYIVFPQIPPEP